MTEPGIKIPLLLLVLVCLLSASAAGSEIPSICCSGGNYSTGSRCQEVFRSLSVTLPWQVANSPAMFARHTIVSGDATYALAECRGDTDSIRCSTCIHEAINKAWAACGLRREVTLFYELCTLQISGDMIKWTTRAGSISAEQVDTTTVQSKAFDTGISALIAGVSGMAANMSERFATAVKEINIDGTKYTAYGLAQCVPELTAAECGNCLGDLWSASSLTGWSGQRSASPWCSYQFHLHKFFKGEPMQTFATLTSNARTHEKKEKEKKKKKLKIILGVVAAALVVILALLAWVILWRKRRSTQKESSGDKPRTETAITDDENPLGAPRATHTAPALGAVVLPSAIDSFKDIIAQADGKMILLFLDYDGTLAPIVKNPLMAFMPPEIRRAVQAAAEYFPTSILTGRSAPKAIDFVKLHNLHYAGSHGLDIKIRDQLENFQPLPELEPLVTQATERLEEAVQGIENASVENNKFCVSVHYREVDERDWRLVEDTVNNVLIDFPDLERASDNMVWEVRPKAKFNKGDALDHLYRYLLQHLQVESSQVVAIHIGDDTTDENAFSMLREKGYGFGIRVQTEPKRTEATYSLKDPFEVMGFLQKLVKWKKLLSGNRSKCNRICFY